MVKETIKPPPLFLQTKTNIMRTIKQYRKKSRKECALLSIYKHLTAGECYSYEATLRIIRKHIKN